MNGQLQTQPNRPFHPEENLSPVGNGSLINPELARVPKGIYNSQAEALQLGQKIGTGGEGSIYEIQGHEDLVAKLYHEAPTLEKIAKLIALANSQNERLSKFSAWPIDVLRDRPNGAVIGFVMKKIGQAAEVHTLHSPKSRLQKFPEASWAFLVHAATNIARAVAAMHEQGYVVGDLNPKNILITKQATVFILDCDSFQVKVDGKVYRCDAGFPDYTPPELQGVPFRSLDRTPEHDCFGLAVVIFQLLFLGRHPFSGRFLGQGEMPLEKAIGEMRFAYGEDAAERHMQQPPGTLQIDNLPVEINELFRRAFLAQDRPNPTEWIAPLENLAQSLQRCSSHNGHLYWQEIDACPWCEIEARSRVRLFNILGGGKDANRNVFRLNDIWREIEDFAQRTDLAPLQEYRPSQFHPSEDLQPLEKTRKIRAALMIVFAVFVGGGVGCVFEYGWPCLFLFLAIFLIWRVSKLTAEQKITLPNLWRNLGEPQPGTLQQKFSETLQDCEIHIQGLSAQWKSGNPEQMFTNKLLDYARKKETLESFSEFRVSRHRQLEEKVYASKLETYLRQFQIADHPHATKKTLDQLHRYNIFTAADLTRPKMRDITKIDEKFLRDLMQWRETHVRRFAFLPGVDVPKADRARVETELDELETRLETELSSAPFYLRQIKEDIDKRAKKLKPELEGFLFQSALMQKNIEVLTKKIVIWPAIVTLFISFFFSALVTVEPGKIIDTVPQTQKTTSDGSPVISGDYKNFSIFYEQGKKAIAAQDWAVAKDNFLLSVPSISTDYWSDEYTEMYYQLAVARKHLGEIKAFNKAYFDLVANNPDDDEKRLQLAISYMVAGNQEEAILQWETLKDSAKSGSVKTILNKHGIKFP